MRSPKRRRRRTPRSPRDRTGGDLDGRERQGREEKAIATELSEAKLPAAAVTEVFRVRLLSAKDIDARKALIEDRRVRRRQAQDRASNRRRKLSSVFRP